MNRITLENTIKEHARERDRQGKIKLVPYDLYDVLEEVLPHGLVVQLGELIIKNKGV